MNNYDNWALTCDQISKRFDQGRLAVDVLKSVNLQVNKGEQVAILGASGSGKSTLLHILGGLDEPTSGTVTLGEDNLFAMNDKNRSRLRNKDLGFVYQFHHLLAEFTALENVAMPLLIGGMDCKIARSRATEILDKVGLSERLLHKPAELSGGERQRAAVARALVNNPRCLLADEPTGNLDEETASKVYEQMLELNRELNTSLIVVTHDRSLAAKMDRRLHLANGILHLLD